VQETATARVELRDDGIVLVRIVPRVRQTLAHAQENMAASIAATGGKRRPLLIDITKVEGLDPEARHYYSGKALTDSFTAIGLRINASPFGRMAGNIYLRISRPGIPSKLFNDDEAAFAWLREFR
jgi:hypothetical protein